MCFILCSFLFVFVFVRVCVYVYLWEIESNTTMFLRAIHTNSNIDSNSHRYTQIGFDFLFCTFGNVLAQFAQFIFLFFLSIINIINLRGKMSKNNNEMLFVCVHFFLDAFFPRKYPKTVLN